MLNSFLPDLRSDLLCLEGVLGNSLILQSKKGSHNSSIGFAGKNESLPFFQQFQSMVLLY